MIIVHHNDSDGRMAAVVAGMFCDERSTYPNFVELDYPDLAKTEVMENLFDIIRQARKDVCVVDISFSREKMVELDAELKRSGRRFIWIDHHATCKDYPPDIEGLRDFSVKGLSACELAWDYFFPDRPEPQVVQLVGDYDSWRHAQAPDCVYLNLYLQSKNASPEDAVWQGLAEHKTCLDKAIECGASMSLYKSGYCEMICDQFGYETELRGLKCFAVNMQRMGKHGFGRRAQQYDACIAYAHNGTHWVVSVYYDKPEVNCGEVCRWLGGGGHKGAAGFTCFHLPFRKNG